MSFSAAHRGAIGRADLLRALADMQPERLALDSTADNWFGYVRQEPSTSTPDIPIGGTSSGQRIEALAGPRLPLRMPFVQAIVERKGRLPASVEPPEENTAEPLGEGDKLTHFQPSPVKQSDLIPLARLLPALRRQLSATFAGPLDVDHLVARIADGEIPRRLPRQCLRRWHPDLVVVLDFREELLPYREDMHRLAQALVRQCSSSGVVVRLFEHGPTGWSEDWQRVCRRLHQAAPWRMPLAGSPVLIVSDLGLLHGAESCIARQWTDFVDTLKQAGLCPLALAPVGVGQVAGALAQRLPLLRWSPDAPMRPVQGEGSGQSQPEGLDDLLAMVAATRRIDPPLLRELRRLNSVAPLNAGLEGALWCHPDVAANGTACIRPDAQEKHLARFGEMAAALQSAVESLRHAHHNHLGKSFDYEETLYWYVHAATEARASVGQRIEDAKTYLDRLLASQDKPDGAADDGHWVQVAKEIIGRADPAMVQEARVLDALAGKLAQMGALPRHPPTWIDPAVLDARLGGESRPAWLVRNITSGWLTLQPEPAGRGQHALGEALTIGPSGLRFTVDGHKSNWLKLQGHPVRLLELNDAAEIEIQTGSETVVVAPIRRPRGIAAWSCDKDGIKVQSPPLCGASVEWAATGLSVERQGSEGRLLGATLGKQGPYGRLHFGIDSYGVWAEFAVKSARGREVQRLRWIEPGRFLMGSPDDEEESDSNEDPQHEVVLRQGFWLADTACTQALWLAVMGNDPSYFKGAALPVERVSWDDVQQFLRHLERLLPDCVANLPTEAEWEYACRAGTTTAYNFGNEINSDRVNYGSKGTVAVKSLPANAWGLYEMHGNVLEWCADGRRDYDGSPQVDPVGPDMEDKMVLRAVRGGSWSYEAGWARSASRDANSSSQRDRILGFRLALRAVARGPGGGYARGARRAKKAR